MRARLVWMAVMALAVTGCAELRTPPPAARIPSALLPGSADPLRDAAGEAASLFADGGRSLAGNPARMARAAALLESLTAEMPRDARFAPIATSAGFELRAARVELRSALGIRANAEPEAASRALTAAHLALGRGDTGAAEAALTPALFEPGGRVTLARLVSPGPLPQARIATAQALEGVRRLEAERVGGLSGALDPGSGNAAPQPVGRGGFLR